MARRDPSKPQLIEAIQKKLAAFPGVIFNFTQPAEDAVDEAETGLKSALAVKIFGSDLNLLADKAAQVKDILAKTPGITEITVVKETGQPSLTIVPDRAKLARYGLNVSDVNTLIGTAMGGQAATQVIQGERQFDMVVRMQEPFRSDENAIRNLLIATPDGQYMPLGQFCDIKVDSGASFIYRESNSRYIGVQFSVEGRDLAGAVGDARKRVEAAIKLAHRIQVRLGRRVQGIPGLAGADEGNLPADGAPDSGDSVRALRKFQVPHHHFLQRAGYRTGGRPAGAAPHAYQFQRFVACWASWR